MKVVGHEAENWNNATILHCRASEPIDVRLNVLDRLELRDSMLKAHREGAGSFALIEVLRQPSRSWHSIR
jgi:hypothetical protein